MVNDWKVKSSASRLELQQLLGILNLMSGCIISCQAELALGSIREESFTGEPCTKAMMCMSP